MLASALLAGFLVGLGTRGNWRRLAELRIRWWPLLVLAAGLRLVAVLPLSHDAARAAYLVSLWALVAVAARNVRLPGGWLITAGIAGNAIVVSLFRGAMPVSADALAIAGTRWPTDPLHEVTQEAPLFGDILPIPALGVYSAGDVLLALGVFVLIVWTMRGA